MNRIRHAGSARGVTVLAVAGALAVLPSAFALFAPSGVTAAVAAAGPGPGGSVAQAGQAGRVALSQAAPHIPAGADQFGSPSGGQGLDLDVVLAGQNAAGLAQTVDAVSTPGSPDYRHYLTAAQYAAQFGPSAAEVAQVSSALRAEGLVVGTPEPGSSLLPVSGTASVVSSALGTPLESVQPPGESTRVVVNTASPQIPASLEGVVTGVVGLDGLFREHSMLKPGPTGTSASPGAGSGAAAGSSGTTEAPESVPAGGSTGGSGGLGSSGGPAAAAQNPAAVAHTGNPQACGAAQAVAANGTYTSTQLASIFGLDQLFGQGRTGIGQSIAVVEFESYAASDVAAFQACYGLSNPIRNVQVDGGAGSGQGSGEAALDTELAAVNAPSASLVVYEAPNGDDAQAFDLFNQIASDDSSQVVTTSWGVCEADMPAADRQTENGIFQRLAAQGQTVIAASGDAGSEDCFPTNGSKTLAVDDPGSQPDVVSAGGTALSGGSASDQTVWNDCQDSLPICAGNGALGATGGGYSLEWPANPGQPAATGPDTTPCQLTTCRAVPDLSYPADPSAGSVAAYWEGHWTSFGGTSVAAPTNAGLFVDTNQGCYSQLGRVGPALYAARQAQCQHVHRRHAGQQRLHQHQPGPVRRRPRLRRGHRARYTGRPEPGPRPPGW